MELFSGVSSRSDERTGAGGSSAFQHCVSTRYCYCLSMRMMDRLASANLSSAQGITTHPHHQIGLPLDFRQHPRRSLFLLESHCYAGWCLTHRILFKLQLHPNIYFFLAGLCGRRQNGRNHLTVAQAPTWWSPRLEVRLEQPPLRVNISPELHLLYCCRDMFRCRIRLGI
jgi:hypothetical protein